MERRKLSRVGFSIGAIIKYKDITFKGEVQNISLNGMFVKTDENIPIGEIVEMMISLIGDTSCLSINLEGMVVREAEDGIGLQYQKVDPDSFIHLKNIISYNTNNSEKVMDEFYDFIHASVKS